MNKLILKANEVKKEFLEMIRLDIVFWAKERKLLINFVEFDIEYPDYEIGESDFVIKHIVVGVNNEIVSTEYIFEDSNSKEYSLWKEWSEMLEDLKKFLRDKTTSYENGSGFYNLLSFLENEKIQL